MTMVGQLVEATPYRLRYLITVTTIGEGPTENFVIPNAFGATPDLRTDAFEFGRSPMFDHVAYTPVLTDIQARIRLIGDGYPNSLFSNAFLLERPRSHLYITPRTAALNDAAWSARAMEGASAGSPASANFSVIQVTGPNTTVFAQCYIDLDYEHTFHR